MCGIVGAVSARNIVPILVEGLKRLEYRGYDSCGVAVYQGGGLKRARSTSRVEELQAQVRAERIEAPLLILHGRKDKRVVPLMTERMVEALEIEDKTHEVHWYDDEGHGWEKRENRRDAFERILGFLRTHVPIER